MITPPFIKKFWLHDPPREVWCRRLRKTVVANGHPRTLVGYQVLERIGLVQYRTATWNPEDGLPFDRGRAHDQVQGKLLGQRSKNHRVGLNLQLGAKLGILRDMQMRDRALGRSSIARAIAVTHALDTCGFDFAIDPPEVLAAGYGRRRGWCHTCQTYTFEPLDKSEVRFHLREDSPSRDDYWPCGRGCGMSVIVM